jgi:hypothetical protein
MNFWADKAGVKRGHNTNYGIIGIVSPLLVVLCPRFIQHCPPLPGPLREPPVLAGVLQIADNERLHVGIAAEQYQYNFSPLKGAAGRLEP